MKIKQIEIVRSYSRTIQLEPYTPLTMFSSYKAICEEGATEEETKEISEYLHRRAEEEVDMRIDSIQNPQKVLRGYDSIHELRKQVRSLLKKVETQENEIRTLRNEVLTNNPPF